MANDLAKEDDFVVNMNEHFDVDDAMEELLKRRYAMPPVVVAAFRQAAMKGAMRLAKLVEDDDKFSKLKVSDQLKVLEMVFDRAYGKNETASSSAIAATRTGDTSKSKHSNQLDVLAQRAAKRKLGKPVDETDEDAEEVTANGSVASMDIFPELRQRAQAANVVRLPRKPL